MAGRDGSRAPAYRRRCSSTWGAVELLCGRQASKPNNAFLFGRHPRMLVVPSVGGTSIELDIRLRISVPKVAFQSDTDVWRPNLELGVRPDHRRMLAQWLASRYTRPAFPDCFNARISRKADQKLGALTKSDCAQNVSGVYLDLGEDWQRDLPDGTNYQARFWFTCRREIYEGSARWKISASFAGLTTITGRAKQTSVTKGLEYWRRQRLASQLRRDGV